LDFYHNIVTIDSCLVVSPLFVNISSSLARSFRSCDIGRISRRRGALQIFPSGSHDTNRLNCCNFPRFLEQFIRVHDFVVFCQHWTLSVGVIDEDHRRLTSDHFENVSVGRNTGYYDPNAEHRKLLACQQTIYRVQHKMCNVDTLSVNISDFKNRKTRTTRLHWTCTINDRIALKHFWTVFLCLILISNNKDVNVIRLLSATIVRKVFEQTSYIKLCK